VATPTSALRQGRRNRRSASHIPVLRPSGRLRRPILLQAKLSTAQPALRMLELSH